MFRFLKKRSKADILHDRYQRLMEEYHQLSRTNRTLSDKKFAEAQAVLAQIESEED